jgi:hypothetical protein
MISNVHYYPSSGLLNSMYFTIYLTRGSKQDYSRLMEEGHCKETNPLDVHIVNVLHAILTRVLFFGMCSVSFMLKALAVECSL